MNSFPWPDGRPAAAAFSFDFDAGSVRITAHPESRIATCGEVAMRAVELLPKSGARS